MTIAGGVAATWPPPPSWSTPSPRCWRRGRLLTMSDLPLVHAFNPLELKALRKA
jgi:hypothetical protein